MIFAQSLIFISLLSFVMPKSLVSKFFSQMDNKNCPSPAPPDIYDPKLYLKNIKASPKFQESYTSFKKISNNLKFDDLTKIILTEDNSKFAISLADIEINTNVSVCIEDNEKLNKTLELFIPSIVSFGILNYYILYDSDIKATPLSRIITIDDSYFYYKNTISQTGCFAIQNNGDERGNHALLFRWKEAQIGNCMDKNNIAIVSPADNPVFGNFSALHDGDCEVIILAIPGHTPNIKINSFDFNSNENIVFKSALNDKPLFEVRPKNFFDWINVLIYSPAMTVIVKANTKLSIECSDGVSAFGSPIINVYKIGQKGIMVSPSYGGMDLVSISSPSYVFEKEKNLNLSMTFYVKEINGDTPVKINSENGLNISLTTLDLGKNITLSGNNIKVTYYCENPKTGYYLIEYTINDGTTTANDLSTTTTTMNPLIITSTIINDPNLQESTTFTFSMTEANKKSTIIPVVVVSMTTDLNEESTTTLLPTTRPTFKPNELITSKSTTLLPETTTLSYENKNTSPTPTILNESESTKQTIYTQSSTPGTSTTESRDDDTTTITPFNELTTDNKELTTTSPKITKAITTKKNNAKLFGIFNIFWFSLFLFNLLKCLI